MKTYLVEVVKTITIKGTIEVEAEHKNDALFKISGQVAGYSPFDESSVQWQPDGVEDCSITGNVKEKERNNRHLTKTNNFKYCFGETVGTYNILYVADNQIFTLGPFLTEEKAIEEAREANEMCEFDINDQHVYLMSTADTDYLLVELCSADLYPHTDAEETTAT